MKMKSKNGIFILFVVAVLIIFSFLNYYILNLKPASFLAPNISKELFSNSQVMEEYSSCFALQKNITEIQLLECKKKASKSWFASGIEDANCHLAQAKSAETECEPIMAKFRK